MRCFVLTNIIYISHCGKSLLTLPAVSSYSVCVYPHIYEELCLYINGLGFPMLHFCVQSKQVLN